MRIINLTPHDIHVRPETGGAFRFPASGQVARVAMRTIKAEPIGFIPTVRIEYGAAELPPSVDGEDHADGYIVSTMFADAYIRQHGDDGVMLLVPDSGPSAIREDGQIVAVRALIRRTP